MGESRPGWLWAMTTSVPSVIYDGTFHGAEPAERNVMQRAMLNELRPCVYLPERVFRGVISQLCRRPRKVAATAWTVYTVGFTQRGYPGTSFLAPKRCA